MSRPLGLRRLFPKSCGGTPETETAGQGAALPGIIESGDFRIDLAAHTVYLLGHELQLTPQEFDVLVFLAAHPQRLVTPHTVLATNWTKDPLRRTEFLKALLSLRQKLDAAASGKHYLRTEPWVVYRFDPASSA